MLFTESALSTSDWIQIISIIASVFLSIVSIGIAIFTLRQTNHITREASRANIVFYITRNRTESAHTLIIKNFGQSSGVVKSIEISPELSYQKSKFDVGDKVITDYTDIHLAPGQSIKSVFYFNQYPDSKFDVTIKYETLNKVYIESYKINLDYFNSSFKTTVDTSDTTKLLKLISESIREVSDKLD